MNMGNSNNKQIYEGIYTEIEIAKAVEIWYNINQAKIKEIKRKSWTRLTTKEKTRITNKFYKLSSKDADKYLVLGRKNIEKKKAEIKELAQNCPLQNMIITKLLLENKKNKVKVDVTPLHCTEIKKLVQILESKDIKGV